MTAKNPFQPATKIQKKLKVLMYGASGSGKTRAALTFPRPAVVDTENGTDLYAGRPGVPAFSVLRAKTLGEVEAAVAFIREDNGKTFDTLVIDAITVLYDVQKDAAAKQGKDGEMNPRLWNKVNGRMVALYNSLTNLPVHVVVIAREAEMYEGEGLNLKRTGTKPDADKKVPYMFDFVVRLLPDHSGVIVKSRGVNISNSMPTVNWEAFEKAAGLFADGVPAQALSDEKAIEDDAQAYADAPAPLPMSRTAPAPISAAVPPSPATPAPLSFKDPTKRAAFMQWGYDKFKFDEAAVLSVLKPVLKDGVYEGDRHIAMGYLLASAAGYDSSEIRSMGKELKLPQEAIDEASLIPAPEIPY